MAIRRPFSPSLALLTTLACAGLSGLAYGGDIRGSVSNVEAGGQVRINLPPGATARAGDQVRLETVVPGIGPVEIKSRWRVQQVGDGFVIAAPVGPASGMPQVGYTAIVTTVTSAAPAAAPAPAAVPPAPGQAQEIPSLAATAEQLAELRTRAESGDTPAMRLLGIYHSGRATASDSVPRNLDEALGWYGKAAQAGDTGAMLALGFLYQSQRRDDASAAGWFGQAAQKGDARAMLVLGLLYAEGRGVPKDAAQSFAWLKKAAEGGNETAAVYLGTRYFSGRGTQQNFGEAAYWFRRAAEKGNAAAMAALAQLYTDGKGVTKDAKVAFEWATKAAEAGASWGTAQVGASYHQGSGVAANAAEAMRWYDVAAQNGEAEAMFGLSVLYANGQGVPADPRVAADWMIKAIDAGSLQAPESLMKTPGKWSVAFRKELQQRLKDEGVYKGAINGSLDAGTRRAIAALSGRALKQ